MGNRRGTYASAAILLSVLAFGCTPGIRGINNDARVKPAPSSANNTPPVVTLTSPIDGTIINSGTASSVTFSGDCSENGKSVSISGSASGSAICTGFTYSTILDLSSLADGALSFQASQTNNAGDVGTSAVINITKSSSAPALASVTITNSNPTNSLIYNLSYGVQSGAYSDYCILENSTTMASCSWTAGVLPSTYTVSATENAKVLSIWIKNAGGITSSRVDSNSVTLDTTAPTLASATVSNPSPTNDPTFLLSYGTQTGTYSHYCILENDTTQSNCAWTAGALPASFTVTTTNNAKVLSIWIKDSAGNISTPRVDTNSVTLDTGAPTLASATVTNTSPTNSTTYNLTYGAQTGTYTQYCILENDTAQSSCSWTNGALPSSFTVSATENAKVLSIWIRDAAGNISTPRVDTNSVTLDTTAPTLASVTVTNTSPTASTTYNLTYGAQSGSYSHYCILENDTTVGNCSWTAGALPSSFVVSSTENAKVLSVWIKDSAGNISTPRRDSNSVTLDTSAPTLASASVTNTSPTASTTYNLSYGAQTGSYTHYCILENDTTQSNCTWTSGALPSSFTVSSTENAKVLSIWIKDGAGNISTPRVDTNSVTLDTTAPTLASATVTNTSPTASTTYNLTYGAQTGTYSHYCILENDTVQANCSWTAGALPASYTVSSTNNAKVLSLWIKDSAGNISTPRVDTNSVTLDTSTPTLASATVTNASPTNSTTYNLTYGSQTGAYTHYCILENDTTQGNCSWTAGALPSSFTVSATENAKVLSIWIKNASGTTSTPRVDTNSVTLDTTAPTLASVTVTNTDPTSSTTYNLTYGSQTGTYSHYCILENDTTVGDCSWTAGALPTSFVVSSVNNAKVLSVWLKDSAGNISTPRRDSNSVTLNTTAPGLASATITNTSPTNTLVYNLSYGTQTGTYSDYCILENDTTQSNCSWTAGALPSTFTVSATENAKTLSIWIKDSTNNVSSRVDTNAVTLDTTAPTLASVTVSNTSPTSTTTYSLTYGSQTGTYSHYCILENDTTQSNCSWTAGALPSSFTVSGTNNAKVLSVWIKDAAGNISTPRRDSNSVTLDTSAPTLASASVTNTSPTNTTTYSLSYGAQTGTYADYCILENDTTVGNCSWTAGVLPASFTVSSTENAKVLSIWIRDSAGNVSTPRVDTNSVTLDTSTPTLASATVTNTSPTASTTYNLTYGTQNGSYSHYCILENDTTQSNCTWTAGALPISFSVSSTENAKVLSIWIKDSAGNISTPRVDTNSVTLDTTAPTLASASVTNTSPTSSTTYNLSYGAQTGTYAQYCILENDTTQSNCSWTNGALPASFTVSSTENAKVLSIWIKDSAGNISTPRVDTNSVTLDTGAPTLASATVTNTSPTNTQVYSLSYGAQTGTYSHYCILENDTTQSNCSWTAGALPSSYSVSSTENAKVLSIWIKDSAGNISTPRVDTNSVTLDTTAPTLASASVTNTSPTSSTTYALSYGAQTGTYSHYCILENDTTQSNCTWTAGALPSSTTVSSTENAKVLSIWIKDSAGNISTPRVDTNSVTLDTTAPTLASASVTNTSPTGTTTYSLSYGAQTGTYSHYCILENDTTQSNCTWTAGVLPSSTTVSSTENAKVLSIWIKDSAGNISTPRVDTNSVTLDTSAPTLASVSVTNSSPTNTTTYSLSFGAQTGTYSHYCILENDTTIGNCSWTAGALPGSKTVSSTENAKVLSVWIKDSAGNISTPRVDSNSVTLDTTPPTLASATVTNSDPTATTTYSLSYGAQGGSPASYCILENDTTVGNCSWTAGALPASFTVSGTNNAKVLSIWTKDTAGNISTPRVDTNSVTLDNTPPTLASASVTNSNPTNTQVYSLSYGAQTGTYSHYCILENDTTQSNCTWTAGALPSSFSVSATENAKVLSIWIKDSLGNVSTPRVDTASITLDTTAPTLASVSVTNTSPTSSTTYNLSYGAQTGTYSHYCILENDTTQSNCSWTSGALPSTYTVSSTENAKVLSVWIKDSAGNISTPRRDSNSVTLDTSAPTLASATVSNSTPTNTLVYSLSYGSQTGTYSDYCILENDTTQSNCVWQSGALPASYSVSATNNAKVLSIWIKDSAGNISTPRVDTNSVTLDTSVPTLASATVTNSDPTSSTTYNLTYGSQTGTYSYYCILENDTTQSNCSWTSGALPTSFTVSSTANAKVLSIWIKDSAGNISTPRVDTNSVTYNPPAGGTATKLAFSVQPSNGTTGTTISPSIKVQVLDSSNNPVNNATDSITLAISTNPGGGNIGGTLTQSANGTSGEATFNNITISKPGTGYILTATSGSLTAAYSNSFTVSGGTPTKIVFTSISPNKGVVSPGCVGPFVVEVQDANSNPSNSSARTITLSQTSASPATFYSDSICTASITQFSIPATSTSGYFYLRSSHPEPIIISANDGGPLTDATFTVTLNTYGIPFITAMSGFEWGALANQEFDAVTGTWGTDINYTTAQKYTGKYSLATLTTTNAGVQKFSNAGNGTAGGASVKIRYGNFTSLATSGAAWVQNGIMTSVFDVTNSSKKLILGVNSAGNGVVYLGYPGTTTTAPTLLTTLPTTLSTNTWYTFEVFISSYSTTATVTAAIYSADGLTLIDSYTSTQDVTSASTGATSGAWLKYNHSALTPAATPAIWYDDFLIDVTKLPDPRTIVAVANPASDGTSTAWTGTYIDVDDMVDQDSADTLADQWVSPATLNSQESAYINNPIASTNDVYVVQAMVRHNRPSGGSGYDARFFFKTGTDVLEFNTAICTATGLASNLFLTPYYISSTPWTWAKFNALEVGMRANAAKVHNVRAIMVNAATAPAAVTTPVLASATITNSSPTSSLVYNISYGAITGSYDAYCILENDTTMSNCSWTSARLPSTYTVSTTQNAKVLSIWLRDSNIAGSNYSARVDTNSVTFGIGNSAPILASLTVNNQAPVTSSLPWGITWGSVIGSYTDWCLLESASGTIPSSSGCAWSSAALPTTYTVGGTNGARIITAYLRNSYGVSAPVSTSPITLDTTGPSITITQPNGGETLTGGNSYTITYSVTDPNGVSSNNIFIEYSKDGGTTWNTVATNLPGGSGKTYSWTVYNVATTQGRIRVSGNDDVGNMNQVMSASNFTVNYQSLPATAIAFVQNPTNANAGSVISPNITVQAVDATGAPVASGSSNVTLTITGGTATVYGTATRAQSAGLATFNDINLHTAGTYTMTATAGALTATSSSFTIAPLGLSTFAYLPSSPTSGILSTCVGPFTVAKLDSYLNQTTQGSVSGNLTKYSGAGNLTFYASSDTTCTGGTISTFSIGSGSSSFSFYIKHDTAESVVVRADGGVGYQPDQTVAISVPYVTSIMLGFEIGNVTNAGAVGTTQGTGVTWGTQVGVTTTDAYTGRFGLFINSSVANWAGIYRNDQWNNTGTGMYVSTKIKYNALTGLATAGAVFIQNGLMYNTGGGTSSSTSDQYGIGLNSSGKAVIYKCSATTCTVLTTGTNTYSASTWYTFQIGSARSASTTVTAKVYSADGLTLHETLTAASQDVQTYTATGPGLSPTSQNMIARYNQNNQTPSGTANIVYDDMVADYTMFPSPKARIYPLNPNAAGSNSAWTGTYSNVSDMTANADPDVGGTSVDTATLNNTSTFAMENPSASGVVLGINLISRWVASTTGAQAKFVMLTGGSAQYRDDTRSTWCNSATATTTNYFYRNAPDGASLPGTNTGTWDTTNLTSLEVGAQLTTAGGATCQIRALVVEAAITN